jgi:hypothetical protein
MVYFQNFYLIELTEKDQKKSSHHDDWPPELGPSLGLDHNIWFPQNQATDFNLLKPSGNFT